jgi:excisionase family DNA binding protein
MDRRNQEPHGLSSLLTRDEVGARLSLAPRTVARLIASGALPCVRIGRSVRISLDDVEQFIKDHRTTSAEG